jgi:mannose-6-phosphate isomerase-like protein (cupin superfamily)
MKTIAKNERIVTNIATAAFEPFVTDGAQVPGQSLLQLDETFPKGTGFHIYRMAPGTRSQPHEHTCEEQFYVIEGEVIDNDGYVYRAGDFALLKPGTQHSSHTVTGATLAVFVRTAERNL